MLGESLRYLRFTLGTARCGQFQHLRNVRVDQEERVLIDRALSHQYEIDFGDRIEAALGVLAFASTETGTRVVLEKIFIVLIEHRERKKGNEKCNHHSRR